MRRSLLALLQRRTRPPIIIGVVLLAACVVVETAVILLLSDVTSVQSLDVIYLFGALVISSVWGFGLGLAAAAASAVAFGTFVLAPTWNHPTWGGLLATLAAFVSVAVLACAVCGLTRLLAGEADARIDADLSATLARLLLRAPDLKAAMPAAARGLARTLGLSSASIEPGPVRPWAGHATFPLCGDGTLATLVVPADLATPTLQRLRDRAVPSLEMLLRAAQDRESIANARRVNRDELQRIADEQTSLRHLATLVARNAPPAEVFDAVAREMGLVLGTRQIVIARYEPDGTAVIVAGSWNYKEIVDQGSRWRLEPGTVSDLVFHTGAPGRVGAYAGHGELSTRLRERGIVSSVGCPIMVGRYLWGVAITSSRTDEPLPADTEQRMYEFTELASAAIANAQSHADLIASRARVVAAADETRRRIERDLHDGTQQNLVSIALDIRSIERTLPPELDEARRRLSKTVLSVESTLAELQEISRGVHPAILTKGGLQPALSALADRSPVEADLNVVGLVSLPERLRVNIYYIVSEALTNAAKHADATGIRVDLTMDDTLIRLTIRDDGVGGADPARGSGLTGLSDRVHALDGRMDVMSPAGGGTTIFVEIPYEA
jgi:signal transduction histidine kinase